MCERISKITRNSVPSSKTNEITRERTHWLKETPRNTCITCIAESPIVHVPDRSCGHRLRGRESGLNFSQTMLHPSYASEEQRTFGPLNSRKAQGVVDTVQCDPKFDDVPTLDPHTRCNHLSGPCVGS